MARSRGADAPSAAPARVPVLGVLSRTRVETSLVAQELKAHYPAGKSACATPFRAIRNTVEVRSDIARHALIGGNRLGQLRKQSLFPLVISVPKLIGIHAGAAIGIGESLHFLYFGAKRVLAFRRKVIESLKQSS